jgi:hypothetical protein
MGGLDYRLTEVISVKTCSVGLVRSGGKRDFGSSA